MASTSRKRLSDLEVEQARRAAPQEADIFDQSRRNHPNSDLDEIAKAPSPPEEDDTSFEDPYDYNYANYEHFKTMITKHCRKTYSITKQPAAVSKFDDLLSKLSREEYVHRDSVAPTPSTSTGQIVIDSDNENSSDENVRPCPPVIEIQENKKVPKSYPRKTLRKMKKIREIFVSSEESGQSDEPENVPVVEIQVSTEKSKRQIKKAVKSTPTPKPQPLKKVRQLASKRNENSSVESHGNENIPLVKIQETKVKRKQPKMRIAKSGVLTKAPPSPKRTKRLSPLGRNISEAVSAASEEGESIVFAPTSTSSPKETSETKNDESPSRGIRSEINEETEDESLNVVETENNAPAQKSVKKQKTKQDQEPKGSKGMKGKGSSATVTRLRSGSVASASPKSPIDQPELPPRPRQETEKASASTSASKRPRK